MKVFWASIEYKYDKPEENLVGGFVYAFVNASNLENASNAINLKLRNESLTVINVEFVKPYDLNAKWEKSAQTKHYKELYLSALNSSDVILDDFYAYENQT